MLRNFWKASRTMILSPVALFLAVLFLPILIVSDNIPIFQQFLDFLNQNDGF